MINKLTDRVYYMPKYDETDRPLLGLIRGDRFSLVVDSGNSPNHAAEFLSEISLLDMPPLKYLVLTHHHEDHIFGINKMNLATIAHDNAKSKIQEMQRLKWDDASLEEYIQRGTMEKFTVNCIKKEIPDRDSFKVGNVDITFENGIKIDLGGISCIIKWVGGTHTDDSVIIHVPEEQVVFLGDCIYGRRYNGVYGYTMEKLLPMIEVIEKYQAKHYLISHEEVYNRNQICELFSRLKTAGTIADKGVSAEDAVKRFAAEFNRQPNSEEAFFIDCFAAVNKAMAE